MYSHYVADFIKRMELHLMLVSVLLKIKFGHAQICVPKIGIPMLKIALYQPLTKGPLFIQSIFDIKSKKKR